MLKRIVGLVMMVDGVMFAMAVSSQLQTFVYRNLVDQSLLVAHIVVGVALFIGGRVAMSESRSKFPVAALVTAFAVIALETTIFSWLPLVARGLYTVGASYVVAQRATLPTI